MALEQDVERIWQKATEDEEFRDRLLANPAVELKKEGVSDVPDDLEVELIDGKLSFSTSDQLALEQLNARVTKSK